MSVHDLPSSGGRQVKRIVLFGLFGAGNLGNDATLGATLFELRRRLPEAEVQCVCARLPEIANIYGVRPLPLDPVPLRGVWRINNPRLRNIVVLATTLVTEPLRIWRVFRNIRGVDILIILGTGVLDDLGVLPWDMPAMLLRWCLMAKKKGVTIELLSVGVGPINNSINRVLMKWVLSLADRRSYRDKFSKNYVEKMGIKTNGDQIFPDLVFLLPREWMPSDRLPLNPLRTIGVGLMGSWGFYNDERKGRKLYNRYIREMGRFINWLMERGYQVRLLLGHVRFDKRAIEDLCEAVGDGLENVQRPSLVAAPINSIGDLCREIAHTDAVVASRFHNLIFALILGRPVISIGYANKFDELMQDMGLGSYCQQLSKLDLDVLISQFSDLMSNQLGLREKIIRRGAEYRKILEDLCDSTFYYSSGDKYTRIKINPDSSG